MSSYPEKNRNVGAYILIGLGVLFLLAQIFNFSFLGAFWPLIIVAVGLPFLYAAFTGGKGSVGFAFPGAIITGTGAILFYQNFTNHWESWAYAWTLYPVFVGMALVFTGRRTGSESTVETGQGMIRWGAIAFAGLWALFELLIFGGDRFFGNLLLPVLLIGAGLLLLFRRGSAPAKRKVDVYYETNTSEDKVKRSNGTRSYSEELQAKIDAALAEPDDNPVEPTKPTDPSLN